MKMNDEAKRDGAWYYYLHTNGDLISKSPTTIASDPEYFNSPFVKKVWKLNMNDRGTLWTFALEALANGANIKRIHELAILWGLTIEDSLEMIRHVKPNIEQTAGLNIFIEKIFCMKLEDYWEMIVVKAEEI